MEQVGMDTDTSADTAFEPTIDELVNDFDDEQTLNEEEAMENPCNPMDEIEALKEEGEMPLEELLAKYALPPRPDFLEECEPRRKKKKLSGAHKNKSKTSKTGKTKTKSNDDLVTENAATAVTNNDAEKVQNECPAEPTNGQSTDCIVIESGDEAMTEDTIDTTITEPQDEEDLTDEKVDTDSTEKNNQETLKLRRSHLFDLYPDQNFDDAIAAAHGGTIALEALYSEDDDEEDIEEEEENDPDYVKKTIMVGSAFQAVIPGLSQYGDVLPYENEDKLVWEPSQVSESEVEEYLLKVREIKTTLSDEESSSLSAPEPNENDSVSTDVEKNVATNVQTDSFRNDEQQNAQKENIKLNTATSSSTDTDPGGVVKDNEQALHLLVQCGYDFKEALRRKKLNAVPLTGGTMSLWSEEECQKFEEGIKKFGKDFLKIRQNQVRTRTMRELVQFYYLWKKSERRDHNFANADTVDHMDIYLNEGEDYNTSPGTVTPTATTTATTPSSASCRKINGCSQNNFSIMTGSHIITSPTKVNNGTIGSKKRTLSDSNASNIQNSGNIKNNGANNSDQISSMPLQNTVASHQK